MESNSSQKLSQCFWCATSMDLIAPQSSALKALPGPRFSDTQRRQSATQFLKMIPQVEVMVEAEPSVFPFIQLIKGGLHKTSLISGAQGGWIETLNFFRIWKSVIEEDEVKLVWLPVRATLEEIRLIAYFQWIYLLLNLAWFLTSQIVAKILTIAAFTTSLHRGLQTLTQDVPERNTRVLHLKYSRPDRRKKKKGLLTMPKQENGLSDQQ